MAVIWQTTFQMHFLELNLLYFHLNFTALYVPRGAIINMPVLIQMIAWHQTGNKPFYAPMLA